VVVEGLGEYQPYLQYYISNTPGHATEELMKKVLQKCSAPLLVGKPSMEVYKVECLTKQDDPRTKCWKVSLPFKFRDVMENDELYPQGWRHRKFFGDRKNQEQRTKQPRMEDPRVGESEQELEREKVALQQRQEDERAQLASQQEQHIQQGPPEIVPELPQSESGNTSDNEAAMEAAAADVIDQ
jgi:hypothetical protein